MRARFLLASILSLLGAASGSADHLVWPTTRQALETLSDVPQVEVRFAFRNEGPAPVRFVNLGASCKCTAPRAEPQVVAPGQAGEVIASIRIDNLPGKFKRTLFVQTDEGPDLLNLDVDLTVTPIVGFTPRLLWWRPDERAERKEVRLSLGDATHTRLLGVRVEKSGFHAEWTPAPDGGSILVWADAAVQDTQTKVFVDYERSGSTFTAFFFATVP